MSREEANQIIKIKEERKAARLAAQTSGGNMAPKTTLTTSATATAAVAVGSSIKTSAPYKEEDGHSSGNNSGNDSHEETEEEKNVSSSARRPSSVGFDGNTTTSTVSTSVELPGYRELLSTRVRVDNGFVSGKGQGKAL
jgi:hypothetical protein